MTSKTPGPIASVHRAMRILRLMIDRGSVSVSEAAAHLEVNPSTASRLLDTMAAEGFVTQGNKRRYVPGPQLLRPGQDLIPAPLRERVRPHLERLYELTQETVHLASLIGTEIHHHDYIEARHHALVFTNRLTTQLPAHVTSAGKAMLADLPWPEVETRYREAPSPAARSAHPAVDLATLRAELEQVRRDGVASNFEESEKGVAAMSASLGYVEGKLISLSVALPLVRYSEKTGTSLREALLSVQKEARQALAEA